MRVSTIVSFKDFPSIFGKIADCTNVTYFIYSVINNMFAIRFLYKPSTWKYNREEVIRFSKGKTVFCIIFVASTYYGLTYIKKSAIICVFYVIAFS